MGAASPEGSDGEVGSVVADFDLAAARAFFAAAFGKEADDNDNDDDDARGGSGLSCVRMKVRGAPSDKEAMTLFNHARSGALKRNRISPPAGRPRSPVLPKTSAWISVRARVCCSPIFSVVAMVADVNLCQHRADKSRQERPPRRRGTERAHDRSRTG